MRGAHAVGIVVRVASSPDESAKKAGNKKGPRERAFAGNLAPQLSAALTADSGDLRVRLEQVPCRFYVNEMQRIAVIALLKVWKKSHSIGMCYKSAPACPSD